jgi:putative flippase GtrA
MTRLAKAREIRRLIVFTTVGASNTAICYALYAGLVHWLAWHHNAALLADYGFGAILGFVGHRLATFADRKQLRRAPSKYLAMLGATLAVNMALLDGLVASRLLGPLWAQAVAMSAVTMLSYLLQTHWVFRSERTPATCEPVAREHAVTTRQLGVESASTRPERRTAA